MGLALACLHDIEYHDAPIVEKRYKVCMEEIDLGQRVFNTIGLLANLPFNIWPYIFFLALPILVFIAPPSARKKRRALVLLGAIFLGYLCINASLQNGRNLVREAYDACQSQFPDGAIQHYPECGEINIADGASYAFAILFGWIPAAAYVGFWEICWRIKHRRQLQQMGKSFKGKWVGNSAMAIFFLTAAYPIVATLGLLIAYWGEWSLLFQK